MSGAVLHICDQTEAVASWIAKEAVCRLYHDLDKVNIPPLVESADVVGLTVFSFVENKVYRTGMILDIKPVADILSLAVYRKRFSFAYVIDEQWNKLLRKLIWTVVVRTIRDHCRKTVSVMEGADEVVRRCL